MGHEDSACRRVLVEQARAGDAAAFARLVQECRPWALGCAVALLGDYHLAQDAVQESFAAAHAQLAALDDPAAFGAWLRTIVRRACFRTLRQHHPELVPLDGARDVASAEPGPEQFVEKDERRREVLAAVATLPEEQRRVVLLHYWREYSHREIAALLGVPITRVNNRLHAARTKLREEMQAMAEETNHTAPLEPVPPAPRGTIVAVHGPVVDVQFAHHRLPPLRSWLALAAPAGKARPLLAVVQYLMDGMARAVVVADGADLKPGLEVYDSGPDAAAPIQARNAREAAAEIARLGHAQASTGQRIVTGLKALDLFCPLVDGDVVGLAARPGLGQIVLMEELIYRLATCPGRLTLVAAVPAGEDPGWEEPYGIGAVQTAYLPLQDTAAPPPGFLDPVDAMVTLSLPLARLGMWPTVDPAATASKHLDPRVVGAEHAELASRARELLRRFPPDQETADRPAGPDPDDRALAGRARRLRRFLSQPMYVAGPWIRWPGAFVQLADTLRGCRGILDGAYDDRPEDAFYMANAIEQVLQRLGAR